MLDKLEEDDGEIFLFSQGRRKLNRNPAFVERLFKKYDYKLDEFRTETKNFYSYLNASSIKNVFNKITKSVK